MEKTLTITFEPFQRVSGSMDLPSTEHEPQFEEQSIVERFCEQICTLFGSPAICNSNAPCFDSRAEMVIFQGDVFRARGELLRGGHDYAGLVVFMYFADEFWLVQVQRKYVVQLL